MASYRGAIVDMDGTLVRGGSLLPGANEGIRALRENGTDLLLFSNNPTQPPERYIERLAVHGISISKEQVLTSALVTAEFLEAEYGERDLFVVGETYLCDLLRERGFTVRDDPDAAELVVGSIDREFDYDELTRALWALEDGAPFVGTDPDVTIPASKRLVPGSGAIINAIAGVAGREPEHILGKPAPEAGAAALGRLGVRAEDCLVVGDRLDTDIALGERIGATTVLVRSGVTTPDSLDENAVQPEYILDNVGQIRELLEN
ncbi:4-nitrophenyl phosphatase [Haladaptatus litoreus]|uniref:4-nitrophenyl phosphatase n=1 Tax=Haladaptatus litoreus TaxID=553468 RepID=A0A1N7E7U8_9EURY|nr:HAD-IIA family hydrolase [Haladaptatus litoreus]SIR84212.1 4-nitrophenyl phosphatase [Haladaptatus litoreus]